MDPKANALLNCINQISFFEGFSSLEKESLLKKVGMFKKFDKKGATIFSEAQKGSSMYVILEGVVAITRASFAHDKKEQVTLAKLKKGSVFGEIALLADHNRTTSAITESSLVIVMVIDKKTLGKDLIVTAETEDKIIMGIMHKKYKIYGVQFHPESIKTLEGMKLIKNFLKC